MIVPRGSAEGAEINTGTDKFQACGLVALLGLYSCKRLIEGSGQIKRTLPPPDSGVRPCLSGDGRNQQRSTAFMLRCSRLYVP